MPKTGVQVCVIDAAGDSDRSNAWLRAGTSALIEMCEPFDELFRTITVLLRNRFLLGVHAKVLSLFRPGGSRLKERKRERLEGFSFAH